MGGESSPNCVPPAWTTPNDYLRFLNAIQRAYAGDLDAFLTSVTARGMLTPLDTLPTGREMTGMSHIDLGFFITVRDDATTWFGHTGSNTGFVCASVASVSGKRGAVVMLNSDNGTPAIKMLLQSITRTRQWSASELDDQAPRDRPGSLGAWTGIYTSGSGLTEGLADRDGEIELTVPGQAPIQLRFDGATTLSTEALDLRVRLDVDGSTPLEQGGHVTRLQRAT